MIENMEAEALKLETEPETTNPANGHYKVRVIERHLLDKVIMDFDKNQVNGHIQVHFHRGKIAKIYHTRVI